MKIQNSSLSWYGLSLAVPIGIAGACVTLMFRWAIALFNLAVFGRSDDITQAMRVWPWYDWPIIVAVGGAIAGILLHFAVKFEKQTAIKSDYLDVINARLNAVPTRSSILRACSSMISISSGASIGKEGPMVQLAALCGSWSGRFVPRRLAIANTDLVAMAAAAGLASVYHAPLASTVFVAEIAFGISALQRTMPIMLAAVTAVLTMWLFGFRSPLYPLMDIQFTVQIIPLLITLLVGVLSGFMGVGFITLTQKTRQLFTIIPSLPVRLACGGAVVGGLAIISPAILGNGYEVIVNLFAGHYLLPMLVVLLVLKMIATSCSVGSGAVGGMFTPALMIGATLGGICGVASQHLGVTLASPWLFAAIGMAAVLSAISQAPLMAILMVMEMTLNSSLLLPLMIACVVATMIANQCHSSSTYPLIGTHFSRANAKFTFDQTRISEVIIPGACLFPQDSVEQALNASKHKRERYVYVVDEKNTFLGVVSIHKIVEKVLAKEITLTSPVEKVMEIDFPYVYQEQTLREGWEAFSRVTLERLPVLNDPQQRQFVGALTKTSLIQQAESFL
ncbi:chloride channel protein [Rosenbergiella australiborealis]